MSKIRFFIGLALVLSLMACKKKSADEQAFDIREYYFPLKELSEGMVYEYKNIANDSIAPDIWYYRSLVEGKEKFLTSTYYMPDLTPQVLNREVMVHNGMLLDDMYVYGKDTTGSGVQPKTQAKIVAGNNYPFLVRMPGGVFLSRVEWTDPNQPEVRYAVIRNRRFAGPTIFEFEGKSYPALRFYFREAFEQEIKDQGTLTPVPYGGEEIYAKGLGRVYYRKDNQSIPFEYRLAKRYPMKQLEDKFREMNKK